VIPVPFRLSALSLGQRLFGVRIPDWFLNPDQEALFHTHLAQIEQKRPWSTPVSQLYMDSKENAFLYDIIQRSNPKNFARLYEYYEEFEALTRNPDTLAHAAAEWDVFTSVFFQKRGRPIPDWPSYVEIQQGLGRYGSTEYHRYGRRLKMKVQEELKVIFEHISQQFPEWKWAARKHCYLTAALWHHYRLPSGRCSCHI
jgi:hypothetical protein